MEATSRAGDIQHLVRSGDANDSTDYSLNIRGWKCLLKRTKTKALINNIETTGVSVRSVTTAVCITGSITNNVVKIPLFLQYDDTLALVRTIKNKLYIVIQ
ncbi:putative replication protein E1 [Trichinella spiralis]|uniref:putative replication protein E1 n=1 Tax=Trichinella spiralis TaxID=6334 RepID=UPI0001EFBB33|nr:putative replication protein E1 [Trichinella spiralis]